MGIGFGLVLLRGFASRGILLGDAPPAGRTPEPVERVLDAGVAAAFRRFAATELRVTREGRSLAEAPTGAFAVCLAGGFLIVGPSLS